MWTPERVMVEQMLVTLDQQLNDAIHRHQKNEARVLYGQILGVLDLSMRLEIMGAVENTQRFYAVHRKFYGAF